MFAPSFPISENLLNVFKGTVNLIKNPSQTDSVYDIEDGLQNSSIMKISLNYIKRHPENVEIIAEQYIAPSPDLNQLLTYPKNSLGYQYAFHLKQAGFDPNFYRPIAITNHPRLSLRQSLSAISCPKVGRKLGKTLNGMAGKIEGYFLSGIINLLGDEKNILGLSGL